MRVFLTGATGLVGRALLLRLQRDGHTVVAWVRDMDAAKSELGAETILLGVDDTRGLGPALELCDAVVHLAGASVLEPWTPNHKRRLVSSRVGTTETLLHALRQVSRRPRVFVGASAVGVFGDAGDEELAEDSPAGQGFLAELCTAWEAASFGAQALGMRTAVVRIGVVLGIGGGALPLLERLARLGLCGRQGHGTQWIPWIHLHDLAELLCWTLTTPDASGVFHGVAPEPVPQATLAQAIAHAVGRPGQCATPAWAIRLFMGARAGLALHGQRVVTPRLLSAGFRFGFSDVDSALADLLSPGATFERASPTEVASVDSDYMRARGATHVLRAPVSLAASPATLFEFFGRAENLGLMTSPDVGFRIRTPMPVKMQAGTRLDYTVRLGPVPMPWATRIEAWEPETRFVDTQLSGPYTTWWHEHAFRQAGASVVMDDRVLYRVPLGVLGDVAQALFVRSTLERIFRFRRSASQLRFGRGD